MSRPAPHNRPLNSSSSGWVSRLNENFSECLDEPFPIGLYADTTALLAAADPKLFKDCLALVGASGSAVLYSSDGTSWSLSRAQLANIADLVPGVATISDIKDAYNSLIGDAQTKGWMA